MYPGVLVLLSPKREINVYAVYDLYRLYGLCNLCDALVFGDAKDLFASNIYQKDSNYTDMDMGVPLQPARDVFP